MKTNIDFLILSSRRVYRYAIVRWLLSAFAMLFIAFGYGLLSYEFLGGAMLIFLIFSSWADLNSGSATYPMNMISNQIQNKALVPAFNVYSAIFLIFICVAFLLFLILNVSLDWQIF